MKQYWSDNSGILHIDVPENVLDELVTVIAFQLNGLVELFEEK
jgi:hypothetical protein